MRPYVRAAALFAGSLFALALPTARADSASAEAAAEAAYLRDLDAIRDGEPVTLSIQCDLRSVGLDCENDVRKAFFTAYPALKREDNPASALLRVKLTDEVAGSQTIVHLVWSSDARLSIEKFEMKLSFTLEDTATRRQKVQEALFKGAAAHLDVLNSGAEGNTLVASYSAGGSAGAGAAHKEYTGPFYLDLQLSGYVSKSGVGAKNPDGSDVGVTSMVNGYGTFTANYSTERIRVLVNAYDYLNKTTVPDGVGGNIESSSTDIGVSTMFVYTLGKAGSAKPKRWNVVLTGTESSSVSSNIQEARSISAKMEYTLVPFRIDQDHEFRFQLGAVSNSLRLVDPNDRGNVSEKTMSALAQLYLYWLLDQNKVSISTNLSASKNLTYRGYASYGATLSFQYQITPAIRFTTGGSYNYVTRSLSYPATPDYSNPAQTQYLGGSAGANYSLNIGLGITLFNGLLHQRDRRGGSN